MVLKKISNLLQNDGITLVEVIIVLAILTIVLSSAFSFFIYGNDISNKGTNQYYTQADLRMATDYIINNIRYATDLNLSTTIPSTIENSNEYDFIYINGNEIIHSMYNEGNSRIVRTRDYGLNSSTFFWSERNVNTQLLGIHLYGQSSERNYDLKTRIELPNISINGNYLSNMTSAKSISFKIDKTLDNIDEEDEEEGESILVNSIIINGPSEINSIDSTISLTAEVLPSNATNKNVSWESSNSNVATVDSYGNVTAVSNGTANIIARATDGSGEESEPHEVNVNTTSTTVRVTIEYTGKKNNNYTFFFNGTSKLSTVDENNDSLYTAYFDVFSVNVYQLRVVREAGNKEMYNGNVSVGTDDQTVEILE